VCGLHEWCPQVLVAALGDLAQDRAISCWQSNAHRCPRHLWRWSDVSVSDLGADQSHLRRAADLFQLFVDRVLARYVAFVSVS
jgi:hypothetical protein